MVTVAQRLGVRSLQVSHAWTTVWIRCAYLVGVAAALLWEPLHEKVPPFTAYGPRSQLLFGTFAQWDAGWFIRIARHGYDVKQSAAFFPLYPLLVRGLAEVVRSTLVAGVLLSIVAGAVGAVLVGRIARRIGGDQLADDSVVLLALYPLAFVLTAVYSDALFLAFAAASFLTALERRTLTASVYGALAVATRISGLALVPALVVLLWPGRSPRALVRLAPLALLPAVVGGYAVYLQHRFGDALAFTHAESVFWLRHTPATGPLGGLWDALRSGKEGAAQLILHLPPPGRFGKPEQFAVWNVLQLLLLIAACWLTWVAWRRFGAAFGLYSAGTILMILTSPAAVQPLASEPRYLLGDFPLFLALASLAEGRPRLRTALVASFAAVGAAAAVAFSRGVWVA
jgi:Mannosyltransferase (PIG-V)